MNDSEKQTNTISKIITKFKTNKRLQYCLIGSLLIFLVIILYFGFLGDKEETNENSDIINAYVLNLENKLSTTLSKVDGVGKVSVVITVESGMETVLAMKTITKETASGTETEESPLVVNGKTVVLTEKYPDVVGVLIVAEGANNISVLSRIQQATVSLLNIKINQIEILTMK